MNIKGSKLIFCTKCNKKRFCTRTSIPDYLIKFECSQGHIWIKKMGTESRIVALEIERIAPKLSKLFEKESIFYKTIKH